MKTKCLLRLRFAGLTTTRIYQLLSEYPNFLEMSEKRCQYLLSLFLNRIKSKYKEAIHNQFIQCTNEDIEQSLKKWRIHYTSIYQSTYPTLLREIYHPPLILFYKGNPQLFNEKRTLAIIGSRQATNYTQRALNKLFPSFNMHHFTIISGLAKGADQMAHQCALDFSMKTIAVLGFGHLNHYPKETRHLRTHLEKDGLVISEYTPYEKPLKHHFPERNRLISGLSRGVLITESTEKSGTCITTQFALDQNRDVYVLPGSLFNPLTKGNLLCAQQGAKIIVKENDFLEDFLLRFH
ncbi:DNA-processing protein DprA [Staphylococcus sp. Marseille-Q5304]|uniref:DNA-processing protein DprA n=1 Tax=Staphylococcus sp. Marseille-Q5304 TaxID=2942200 RepID=UPI002073BD31|nr:DNA-processing protein DprA [Staphylococcus sp. Marseille-Q5304]